MKILQVSMRGLCGFDSSHSVIYEEIVHIPQFEFPPTYKIPKFENFNGSGNPFFHLKIYYGKFIGIGNNEGIRIKIFNQSLTRKALDLYAKQDLTKWHT